MERRFRRCETAVRGVDPVRKLPERNSPDGIYVLINGERVHMLEQRAAALTEVKLLETYHPGKDSLLR